MIVAPFLFALAAAQSSGGFSREESTDLLDFSYSWPAEVDRAPALRARLRADMAHDHAEMVQDAREGQALAREQQRDYNKYDYSKSWHLAGISARLISLAGDMGRFEGGAHPNGNSEELLWDRRTNRVLDIRAMLGAAALRRLTPRYCAALNAERRERDIDIPEDDSVFPRCPALRDLRLVPADSDHDGRFDSLEIHVDPYVAGPYVDGAFQPVVRFQAADLAAIPSAYRASFAPARR